MQRLGHKVDVQYRADTQTGEWKIISNRIRDVKSPETAGNFKGRWQVGLAPVAKPKAPADGVHVGIQWDDQVGGRQAPPAAGIYLVAADHPPQVEMKPLAGAGSTRIGQQGCGGRGSTA